MGSAKEYYLELWSQISVDVEFLCPECGHPAQATLKVSPEDQETFEEVVCLNSEDAHEWTVVIRKGNQGYFAEVENEPGVDVGIILDDNEDFWDEPEPEPNAYDIFLDAMHEWKINVKKISKPEGYSSRNRMLFGTLYSIVEAYFSDTIMGSALLDNSVQKKLLNVKGLGLKDKKLSLTTVLEKPNIVQEMIHASLRCISYHNLSLVNQISEVVFGNSILPKASSDRKMAIASVPKRHDCVHRNGVDTNGKKHTDITPLYLGELGRIFEEMACALENAISKAKVQFHFTALPE